VRLPVSTRVAASPCIPTVIDGFLEVSVLCVLGCFLDLGLGLLQVAS
jgi:hypothetical protein